MVSVLGLNTKGWLSTLGNCRYEEVSWDSGCKHEGSHLMHDTEHFIYINVA